MPFTSFIYFIGKFQIEEAPEVQEIFASVDYRVYDFERQMKIPYNIKSKEQMAGVRFFDLRPQRFMDAPLDFSFPELFFSHFQNVKRRVQETKKSGHHKMVGDVNRRNGLPPFSWT